MQRPTAFKIGARATVAVTLLTAAACSQAPAQVELKGQGTYTQNASNGYSSTIGSSKPASYVTGSPYNSTYTPPSGVYNNYPAPQITSQSAGVQSIGVSDLPPPPKSGSTNLKPMSQNADIKPQTVTHVATVAADPVSDKPKSLTLAKNQTSSPSHGFIWPVNGTKVISGFGAKGPGKANDGINIAAADGEPVWAAADGEVVYVGDQLSGYGNMVLIKHAGDKTTTYAHLSRATVDKYDRVKQGDIIGFVGTTGDVKTPQLHFAVNAGTTPPLDPAKYLTTKMASN